MTTPSAAAPGAPPQPRPLRREGAMILLTREEQDLEEAMNRSSPAPDPSDTMPVIGKRTRDSNGDDQGGDDTEPDDDMPAIPQLTVPTISNITTTTLRYAAQKRLRTEQRGELDYFLQVSTSLLHRLACSYSLFQHCAGLGAGPTG